MRPWLRNGVQRRDAHLGGCGKQDGQRDLAAAT